MLIRRPVSNRKTVISALIRIRDSLSNRLIGKVNAMSNKLRSFLIVVVSIVVVAVALPIMSLMVKADPCTITFHSNYGTDASEVTNTQNIEIGTATNLLPLSTIGFNNVGYTFAGWNENADGSGKKYNDVDEFTSDSAMVDLYAQWVPNITITFIANDEADPATDDKTQTVGKGIPTKLDANSFARDDYEFVGWNTDPNSKDVLYKNNVEVTLNENITLYAVWKKCVTVTLHPNNSTTETMPKQVALEGETKTLDLVTFTKPANKIFGCWTTAEGVLTESYWLDGASYTFNEDAELYAYWEDPCTITFETGDGTGTPYNQTIPQNISVPLKQNTFEAPEHMEFKCWSENQDGSGTTYTDKQAVTFNVATKTLYAQWKLVQFEVTTSAGANGTVTTPQKYDYGTNVTITAAPNEGYHVSKWVVDGTETASNDKTYTIENIDAPHTVSVEFAIDTFAVEAHVDPSSIEGASVSGAVTDANYGTDVTLTATVPDGYHVAKWVDNSIEYVNQNKTFEIKNITANHEVKVYIEINTYKITTSCGDHGSITTTLTCDYGTSATITATPEEGYHVAKWTVDGVVDETNSETFDFTDIKLNHTVRVDFEINRYAVSTNSDSVEHGTVTATDTYEYGKDVTITATPATGYHVSKWIVDDVDVTAEGTNYTFTGISGAHTVSVEFAINTYNISIAAGDNGDVSGSESGTYNHFDSITVTATPDTGYHFVNWTEDGTEVIASPEYTFMVTGARNLTANFAINSYAIDISAGKNGSVSGSESGTYNHSSSVTVTATPDKGYHFVNWTENGTEVSTDPEYTFTVTGARNLKANFDINMYTVTYKNDDGTILQEGEMSWGSTASYQHMANPTKKPTAQFTYTFAGWDNKETLVTKDITYTATYTYTVNKYKITFANEDGTVLQTSEVEYGKFPVYEKDTPTKAATVQETFTFAGWDKEISKVTGETVYTATYTSKPITKDSINYKYFTVAFVTNGGSEIVSQLVAEGGVAFKPEEPLRERYTFGGWYIDEALTKPFSFATAITSDITLYAKWIKGSPDIEATYAVVGLGSTSFELGSGEDITVAVERSKDNDSIATHFKGVLIDGVEVDYYNYELAEDNSSVIIRADALEGLDAGTHTITIVYDDGTAEVELVVADANEPTAAVEKITETEAGDTEPVNFTAEKSSNWGLWIALGIVAVVVIAAIPIFIIKGRSLK